MGTEKGIVSSGAVLSLASKSLLIPVNKLQHGLSVTVPADTNLLVISYSDADPQVAQSAAEAIAHAYVAYRTSTNQQTTTRAGTAPPSPAGAVQATVVTDAALPTSPVNPNRLLIIGAAAALGVALGIGLALLRDWLDDSLRDHVDLEIQANAPVLAEIPTMPRGRHGVVDPLAVIGSPNSRVANAYLGLRTRVLHAAASREAKTILVTSPGGEDKATVAANLAAALALSGRKVVLVCADPRWGRADALFGMDREAGLTSIVHGHAKLAGTLRATALRKLRVLPSGPAYADSSSVSQSTAFRGLLRKLTRVVDFVVIDAPPVLTSPDTGALVETGVMLLLVADARATTRARARAAANELGHVHDSVVGWVLDHERGVRRLAEPSGHSPVPDSSVPATQAAPILAPLPRPLTWDDISGESTQPAQKVAAVNVEEREVRPSAEPSGHSPMPDSSMPATQAAPIPAPPLRPLTWDDISGESTQPAQKVAAVNVGNQIPKSGRHQKATSNGSYEA
jgi:capsular exopolysaccharide synthesis family protein